MKKINSNYINNLLYSYKVDSCVILDTSNMNSPICARKANINSIFEAASLTKVLFAYLVLKLEKENIISLDDKLVDYNIDLSTCFSNTTINNTDYFNKIKVSDILSHSSGIENWTEGRGINLYFEPGFGHLYSGNGYYYLQKVIEKITNKSIEDLFIEYIFKPLNMTSSSLSFNDKINSSLIDCYNEKLIRCDNRRKMNIANVAYTLYTSIIDYNKFINNLLYNELDIIEMMYKKHIIINKDLSWDLGIANINDKIYWQWGDNYYFKNFLLINKETNNYIIYFSNSVNGLDLFKQYLIDNNYIKEANIIFDYIANCE